MLFPESWLRSVVNPSLDTEALAHQLTMAGLEIEDVTPVAPEFTGVIVARIDAIEQHPNADKLRICQVNTGKEILQIVCGAPNAAVGLYVPLAQIGARLPGHIKISKGKLRGVESFGMLCSAREMGLPQDYDGLWELDPNLVELGQDIRQVFRLDEQIFELKITPNRADCLSIKGIAREVSALTGASLKPFDFTAAPVSIDESLPVHIHAPDLCGRFAGRIIRGVNAKAQTPAWMVERLERAGQRSVSALVDISNYVMLELGTPSHIFDLDKISSPEIHVDWATTGAELKLLNEETVELDSKVGVVKAGDKIEAIAGVMGGWDAAVDTETKNIFIEQAFWHPAAIAGITRRFKLNSEAAYRFERGVDFACLVDHLEYLTRLVLDICGGQAGPIDDQIVNLPSRKSVRMRVERCHKILGIEVPSEQMAQIFSSLQFDYQFDDNIFSVTPPSWRFDIAIEEDLIEEIARVYGFDKIPANPPVVPAVMLETHETERSPHTIRQLMVDQDYQEVINFSFVPPQWEQDYMGQSQPIRLLNPIASQLAVMRTGLIAGLVDNVIYNAKRKQTRVRVFELGAVFIPDASVQSGAMTVKGIQQPQHLAAVAWGSAYPEQWGLENRSIDFFDVKADLCALLGQRASQLTFVRSEHPALHPGRSANIFLDGQEIGFIGELHPSLVQKADLNSAPVVFEISYAALSHLPLPRPSEYSRQPAVWRDLAIWAPTDLPVQSLLDSLHECKDPSVAIIQEVTLFDVWRDAKSQSQERSLAFRFVLQDAHHTLEDAQVEQCMSSVLDFWMKTFGVRQR